MPEQTKPPVQKLAHKLSLSTGPILGPDTRYSLFIVLLLLLLLLLIIVKICPAPHLEMSPKHFTMAICKVQWQVLGTQKINLYSYNFACIIVSWTVGLAFIRDVMNFAPPWYNFCNWLDITTQSTTFLCFFFFFVWLPFCLLFFFFFLLLLLLLLLTIMMKWLLFTFQNPSARLGEHENSQLQLYLFGPDHTYFLKTLKDGK